MSSIPPYEGNNPYVPPTQYPQSGYYPVDQPPYGYQQPQQVYVAPPYGGGVAVVPINEPGSTAALVGMILGIVGIFFPIVAIAGLITSIFGLKSVTRKGMAIAGLVTSIVGILFIVFWIAIVLAAIASSAANPPPTSTYP